MIRKTIKGGDFKSQMVGELVFDQVPEEGSFNPVTSDAVVKAIDEAKEDMQEKIDEVTLDPSAVALGNVHLLDEVTEFPADGCILVDSETNGPGEMSKDTLLELTAQNALAGNVATAFDADYTYSVGENVIKNGISYKAVSPYNGDQSSNFDDCFVEKCLDDVDTPINLWKVDSPYIENGDVVSSTFKSKMLKVPSGINNIRLTHNGTSNVLYVRFLTSSVLVPGESAPVIDNVDNRVNPAESKTFVIPEECVYVYVYIFSIQDIRFEFSYDKKSVYDYKTSDVSIGSSTVESSNGYRLHDLAVDGLEGKYLHIYDLSNNTFKLAYSTSESRLRANDSLSLLAGSTSSGATASASRNEFYIPIPTGVKRVLVSHYIAGSSFKAEIVDECPMEFASNGYFTLPTGSSYQYIRGCNLMYGEDVCITLYGTSDFSRSSILVMFGNVNEYMSMGVYQGRVTSPIIGDIRFDIPGGRSASIVIDYSATKRRNFSTPLLKVCSLNAGCMDLGVNDSARRTDADAPEFIDKWKKFISKINCDIILFCEWWNYMSATTDYPSFRNIAFSYQFFKQMTSGQSYCRKAICSFLELVGFDVVTYQNQSAGDVARNYAHSTVRVNGFDLKLVVTHLNSDSDGVTRGKQINELVEAFGSYDKCVICGDFNTRLVTELQPLVDAGFSLSNGGNFADVYTGVAEPPLPTFRMDNICCKGVKIRSVRYEVDPEVTDHKAIISELYV